jgi:hypothetical protein
MACGGGAVIIGNDATGAAQRGGGRRRREEEEEEGRLDLTWAADKGAMSGAGPVVSPRPSVASRCLPAGVDRVGAHVPVPVCSLACRPCPPAARRGPAPPPSASVSPCGVRRCQGAGWGVHDKGIHQCMCACLLDRLQPLPHTALPSSCHAMPCHDPVRVRMMPCHAMPRPGECHVRRCTQAGRAGHCHIRRTSLARTTSQSARDNTTGSFPRQGKTKARALYLSNTVDLFGRLPLSGSLKIRCSICIARSSPPKTVSGYPLGALQARGIPPGSSRQGREIKKAREEMGAFVPAFLHACMYHVCMRGDASTKQLVSERVRRRRHACMAGPMEKHPATSSSQHSPSTGSIAITLFLTTRRGHTTLSSLLLLLHFDHYYLQLPACFAVASCNSAAAPTTGTRAASYHSLSLHLQRRTARAVLLHLFWPCLVHPKIKKFSKFSVTSNLAAHA